MFVTYSRNWSMLSLYLPITTFLHLLIHWFTCENQSISRRCLWSRYLNILNFCWILVSIKEKKNKKATCKWWTSELDITLIKMFDSDTPQSHDWSRLSTLCSLLIYTSIIPWVTNSQNRITEQVQDVTLIIASRLISDRVCRLDMSVTLFHIRTITKNEP